MPNKELKKIAIITKKNIADKADYLIELNNYLEKKGKKVLLCNKCAPIIKKNGEGLSKEIILKQADMALVLGGDGTLLKTARCVGYKKVPILGVNMGTLGFLTEVIPKDIYSTLERIWKGKYVLDTRTLLRVTVYRGDRKIYTSLALNDAVINQGSFARLINLRIEINQRKVNDFHADGLIISTPTGSTGHALSAGGPIVNPALPGIIVTPICPAALSNRPIVIPNDRQIKVILGTDRADVGLTLDGQESLSLEYKDEIKIRRSTRKFHLIRKTGENYYKMLRDKLHWGGGR